MGKSQIESPVANLKSLSQRFKSPVPNLKSNPKSFGSNLKSFPSNRKSNLKSPAEVYSVSKLCQADGKSGYNSTSFTETGNNIHTQAKYKQYFSNFNKFHYFKQIFVICNLLHLWKCQILHGLVASEIRGQIAKCPNQIARNFKSNQIESPCCEIESPEVQIESQMASNRDSNRIAIWFCPWLLRMHY